MIRIEASTKSDRSALREAAERLMRRESGADAGFLVDAWNQELWVALAAAGWQVPEPVARSALRLNNTERFRIRATIKFLNEETKGWVNNEE